MSTMWTPMIDSAGYVLAVVGWALAGAIGAWILLVVPYRWASRVRWSASAAGEEIVLLFFATLLGLTIGVMTGLSRQAAIGAVVPAILTVIAGFIGYLYAADVDLRAPTKYVILVSTLCLTACFFWGALTGQALRAPFDQYERELDLYKLTYQADLEKAKLRYQAELDQHKMRVAAEMADLKKTAPKR